MLKIGNVVHMKGASHVKMTVEAVSNDGDNVRCVWFDTKNQLHRNSFAADLLIKV